MDQQLESTGALLMFSMAIDAIASGALPPASIFKWTCDYAIEALKECETSSDDEMSTALAEQVAMLMRVCESTKQLTQLQKMKDALKARLLYLHPTVDGTYGGHLSWV